MGSGFEAFVIFVQYWRGRSGALSRHQSLFFVALESTSYAGQPLGRKPLAGDRTRHLRLRC